MRYIAEARSPGCREDEVLLGIGKGRSVAERQRSALGEAVERQHFVHSHAHRLCSAAELDGNFVRFDELGLAPGKSADRRKEGTDNASHIAWSLATDLASSKACWVPHERRGFVQGGYRPTTSGWASQETGHAELPALLELIERDAALLSWYGRDFGFEIVGVDDDVADIMNRQGWRIRLFLLTKDIDVPVVWAWARCCVRTLPLPYGASIMSVAAALASEDAIRASIDGVVQKLESFGSAPCAPFSGVPSHPREHVLLYLDEAAGLRLASLVGSPPRVEVSQFRRRFELASVQAIVLHLADRGYRSLVVDETQDYAKRVQVSVCRAVVPGLLPMSFGTSANARISLLAERLRAVGLPSDVNEVASLPPHPFA